VRNIFPFKKIIFTSAGHKRTRFKAQKMCLEMALSIHAEYIGEYFTSSCLRKITKPDFSNYAHADCTRWMLSWFFASLFIFELCRSRTFWMSTAVPWTLLTSWVYLSSWPRAHYISAAVIVIAIAISIALVVTVSRARELGPAQRISSVIVSAARA